MQDSPEANAPDFDRVTTSPKVLLILDGFGIREEQEDNAIAKATTPNFDRLWQLKHHCRLISASGNDVGLPEGQMGNSEVGHMNIGAGRILYQDLTRITLACQDGSLNKNPVLIQNIANAVQHRKAVHILGLLSPGGVHSHEYHIGALVEMAHAQGATEIYVHAFLDGRDTPPKSASESIQKLSEQLQSLENEAQSLRIATVTGRFYAMDRDQRWDRVKLAYDAIVHGKTSFTSEDAQEGLQNAYKREETDEFVQPTRTFEGYSGVQNGDTILFANFRSDRAQQLSSALFNDHFTGFKRKSRPTLGGQVTMTSYGDSIQAHVAFSNDVPALTLGEIVSSHGLKQLRLAETEKYAHVTFFMNAGRDDPWPGEERQLVPSPNVRTYDEAPAMSLPEVTQKLCAAIESKRYSLIICNFANADMVGHTGKMDAAVQAIECIDKSLGLMEMSLTKVGGEALITADHGNAEQMRNPHTDQPHTSHTTELVPLIYVGPRKIEWTEVTHGRLSDLAPTLLKLMDLEQPEVMTGRSLIK